LEYPGRGVVDHHVDPVVVVVQVRDEDDVRLDVPRDGQFRYRVRVEHHLLPGRGFELEERLPEPAEGELLLLGGERGGGEDQADDGKEQACHGRPPGWYWHLTRRPGRAETTAGKVVRPTATNRIP